MRNMNPADRGRITIELRPVSPTPRTHLLPYLAVGVAGLFALAAAIALVVSVS